MDDYLLWGVPALGTMLWWHWTSCTRCSASTTLDVPMLLKADKPRLIESLFLSVFKWHFHFLTLIVSKLPQIYKRRKMLSGEKKFFLEIDQPQVVRLVYKYIYPLSHLAGPHYSTLYLFWNGCSFCLLRQLTRLTFIIDCFVLGAEWLFNKRHNAYHSHRSIWKAGSDS